MNHTPGPWKWRQSGKDTFLSTPDRGQLTVMDFVRCGMNSGQPRFAVWDGEERERLGGLMKKAEDFTNLYDHPDARLIAAAPALLEAVKHLKVCGVCAQDSLEVCDGGRAALAALALCDAPTAEKEGRK